MTPGYQINILTTALTLILDDSRKVNSFELASECNVISITYESKNIDTLLTTQRLSETDNDSVLSISPIDPNQIV